MYIEGKTSFYNATYIYISTHSRTHKKHVDTIDSLNINENLNSNFFTILHLRSVGNPSMSMTTSSMSISEVTASASRAIE